MLKLILSTFIVLLFTIAGPAQPRCPQIQVMGPTDSIQAGGFLMFMAVVSGGDEAVKKTYNWIVSAGTITKGQGTDAIDVDTRDAAGMSITATVDIGGFDRSCSTSASATIFISQAAKARKMDEFPYLRGANLEAVRLDNVAIELQNDPTSKGHIIFYRGRKGLAGAIQAWTKQTVGHLLKRGVDKARITSVDGGYKETGLMEIWIVPEGAELPTPSPTVDPSEISPPVKKPATKRLTTRKKV